MDREEEAGIGEGRRKEVEQTKGWGWQKDREELE